MVVEGGDAVLAGGGLGPVGIDIADGGELRAAQLVHVDGVAGAHVAEADDSKADGVQDRLRLAVCLAGKTICNSCSQYRIHPARSISFRPKRDAAVEII